MARLTAASILTQTTMPEEVVTVPEWEGDVLVRGLTKGAQQEMRKAAQTIVWDGGAQSTKMDNEKFELALFMASVADPVFSEDQAGQLLALSAGAIDRVNKVAMRLSGMTPEGKTSQAAVDAAQKSVPI